MCAQSENTFNQAHTQSATAALFLFVLTSFHLSHSRTHRHTKKHVFTSSATAPHLRFINLNFSAASSSQHAFLKQNNRLSPCDTGWQIYEADLCHGCHVRVQCVSEVALEISNWITTMWQGWRDGTTVLDPYSKDGLPIWIDHSMETKQRHTHVNRFGLSACV